MVNIILPGTETERRLVFYLAMEEYVAAHLDEILGDRDSREAFFHWQVSPTVIFGRNQVMEAEVNIAYCKEQGIKLFRRKSGGGCVYSDRGNIMLSFISGNTDVESTFGHFLGQVVTQLRSIGLNAERSGRNDILLDGRKISGNAFFGLNCHVYMVKCSYEQKPFRREVMRTYGANVTPSPSMTTEIGKKINAEHPDTTGSLGCAISEAVEAQAKLPNARYLLGSVLNQVCLHQSIIGLETQTALKKLGVKPDVIIGCAGGGSNLAGLIAPFMGEKLRGEADYRFIAVEPASCPSLTRGVRKVMTRLAAWRVRRRDRRPSECNRSSVRR